MVRTHHPSAYHDELAINVTAQPDPATDPPPGPVYPHCGGGPPMTVLWSLFEDCTEIGCKATRGEPCVDTRTAAGQPTMHPHLGRRPDLCRARTAEGWPGERPCQFPASRPSGLCGVHDRARQRAEEKAAADVRRSIYARDHMARIGPLCRALVGLGIDAQPRLSGVLLTMDAAERLIARLTSTEGAAQ